MGNNLVLSQKAILKLNTFFHIQGDTGSPLLLRMNYLFMHVGIASFHSGNGCESSDPSGYTRTYSYVDWIRSVTSSY